jgi:hypothetical protein
MELVTGNPKTVNSTGGARGTGSAAASVGVCADTASSPADGGEDGCAFTVAATIAARNAPTKMMMLNRFTLTCPFQPTPIAHYVKPMVGLKDGKKCLIVKKFTSIF